MLGNQHAGHVEGKRGCSGFVAGLQMQVNMRLRRATGVAEDAVAHVGGEVESAVVAFEPIDDPQRMLEVAKVTPEAGLQAIVEDRLAEMPEGRVPEVVAKADRLCQVLVESQRAGDRATDLGDLDSVGQAGPVVIVLGCDEDLRLAGQATERLAVHDPVAVALQRRAQLAVRLGVLAIGRIRPRRVGSEHLGLELLAQDGVGGCDGSGCRRCLHHPYRVPQGTAVPTAPAAGRRTCAWCSTVAAIARSASRRSRSLISGSRPASGEASASMRKA